MIPRLGVAGTADGLVADAEKRMNAGFVRSLLTSGSTCKHEDAVDLLQKAAAMYKMSQSWNRAGDVYVRCAHIYRDHLNDQYEQTVQWERAAQAYAHVDSAQARRSYEAAVLVLTEDNRFSSAARIWKEIALLAEKDNDYAGALAAYEKSANCFDCDNQTLRRFEMATKCAHMTAKLANFREATTLYERLSSEVLSHANAASAWTSKDHMFRALICLLASGATTQDVRAKVEHYATQCPRFDGTREKDLMLGLCDACDEADQDAFQTVLSMYDAISPLDRWMVEVLELMIRARLDAGDLEQMGVAAV
jgi:tetratricopeptide (TPR) repeat protein